MSEQMILASSNWAISLGQDLRARLDAVTREKGAGRSLGLPGSLLSRACASRRALAPAAA